MRLTTTMKRAAGTLVLLVCYASVLLAPASVRAEELSAEARQAILAGADLERSEKWLDAIEHYEKALKGWPDNT